MLAIVAWVALLCTVFVAPTKLPGRLCFLPASIAWNIFTAFILFAILSAILTPKNRGFWTGVAVFGAAPILAGILPMNSMIQNPSTGRVVLESLGIGLNPDVSGDDAFVTYMTATVPVANLAVATATVLLGGFTGERITRQRSGG